MTSVSDLEDLGELRHVSGAVPVVGVRHDSREVQRGEAFVAIRGGSMDGTRFAAAAVDRGAAVVVTDAALEADLPQLVVADARRALAAVAHRVYGDPTARLHVVGITGTNGKTTTAHVVESMWKALGRSPALLGTTAFRGPGWSAPAPHTTPEADVIARFALKAAEAAATDLVMEVSSHALAMHRADHVRYDVAAFTNLTRDHLDFHGTFEAYGDAKARLFLDLAPAKSVIMVDEAFGAALAERIRQAGGSPLRCALRSDRDAELLVVTSSFAREGVRAEIETTTGAVELRSPLVGPHNLENLLVALGVAVASGVSASKAAEALADADGAPGRLERVRDPRGTAIFVDYAHTPDALTRALHALRPLTAGRLICVFGCGGDRDPGKRPRMGEAVARGADLAVVTSDNPRTEEPDAIVDMIVPGIVSGGMREGHAEDRGFLREVDRAAAIALALEAAGPEDTVLIAGKGHEDYQIIGAEKRHFDDREVARRVLENLAQSKETL